MPISTAVTHPSPVTVVVAAWLAVGGSQWLRWRRVAVVAVAGGVCGWWVCGGLLEDLWVMAGFG
uniref:Uncharacterized protein n=1 Tax=Fagus sylvatica TaxID=28930 RepID=A0A2N9J5Y4_FAGSY